MDTQALHVVFGAGQIGTPLATTSERIGAP